MTKKLFIFAVAGTLIPLSLSALSGPPFETPAPGLEAATKEYTAQKANEDQATIAKTLENKLKDLAIEYKTDSMTVALYLAKAGLPAATIWINEYGASKAKELGKAINDQLNPDLSGPWFGHNTDWKIIEIALKNGADYSQIREFGAEVRGAPKSFQDFIATHAEFKHLPELND